MAETIRLNKVLRELNISIDRAVDFLETKGIEVEKRPTTKISDKVYQVLSDEFQTDANKKVASQEVSEAKQKEKEALRFQREKEIEAKFQKEEASKKEVVKAKTILEGPKQVGKIDLNKPKKKTVEPVAEVAAKKVEVVKEEEAPKKEESPKAEEKKAEAPIEEKKEVSKPIEKKVEEIKVEKTITPKI